MRKYCFSLFVLILFAGMASAQEQRTSIIEDLNKPKSGQGEITILQDESIQEIVATLRTGNLEDDADTSNTKGKYRIQVFSGNNNATSRQEAYSKQALIKGSFPQFMTVVNYDAPVWRLRVGNFLTKEDAATALKDLKAQFPTFGREMIIITVGK